MELPDFLTGRIFEADSSEPDDEVIAAAKKYFKIKYLFPWQRLVVGNILDASADLQENAAGKNDLLKDSDCTDIFCLGRQIVLLPTGAGKSLCFLLPAMLLKGPTLIFYPLLALMADQKNHLEKNGIECVTFRGGQSDEEREENFFRIKAGVKIILANPEVLQNRNLLTRLKNCGISHIAIDEAHCVSEWGDTFRPAYLTLGKIIADLGVGLVTAFTATASPKVLSRVSEVLFGGRAHLVRGDSDRPNIHYFVEYAWAKSKAVCRLAVTERRPMIIFCGTRGKSENMARELKEVIDSECVRFYHAGMSRAEKKNVEEWFYPKKDAVLCCTCAFGMGVDKPDVRTVVHLEASPSAESYIQEAGRGGRDRQAAKAILLWSREDSLRYEKYHCRDRRYVLKLFAESRTCRRQVLLDALGGEKAVCSGCDICGGNKKNVFDADDAVRVYKFIRKNQNYYNKKQAVVFMKKKFNERDRRLFGVNVWDTDSVSDIIAQLTKSGAVYNSGFLWNFNLAARPLITYPPRRPILSGLHRRPRHYLLVLLRRLKRLLEEETPAVF